MNNILSPNMTENIKELQRRGYAGRINHDLNENEWFKGDLMVSIHTVRSCSPEYFRAVLGQKEKSGFQFRII